uniref:POTRA domain-containing protein n=1 Tax=Nitophyllum punctatum TaxID=158729 RepID=A0A4D6WV87_9FLOR|nr:hypothetical protein [Nitophyllum punctatum]
MFFIFIKTTDNYINTCSLNSSNLAFNINYLYNSKIQNFSHTLFNKYLLLHNQHLLKKNFTGQINIFAKYMILNIKQEKLNISFIKNLKQTGYFSVIDHCIIYTKNYKYIILKLYWNPILKKVKIYQYNKLKIPKHLLIKLFATQIGIPINYINIRSSLNEINQWYKFRGLLLYKVMCFKSSEGNELHIKILESKIINHISQHEIIAEDNSKKNNLIRFNRLIKRELLSYSDNIINFHKLNLDIKKINNKYNLNTIRYKIENNINSSRIIILYSLLNHKQIGFDIYKILKLSYKIYKYCTHSSFKYIFSTNLKSYISSILYSLIKIYELTWIICKKNFKDNYKVLNIVFNKIHYIANLTQYKYYTIYSVYIQKNHLYQLIKSIKFQYLIDIYKFHFVIHSEYVRSIQIIQDIGINHSIYYAKEYFLFTYNQYFQNQKIRSSKKIESTNASSVLVLNIQINQQYKYLFRHQITNKQRIVQLYYSLFIYLNTYRIYSGTLIKYYNQYFVIYYKQLHKISKIMQINSKLQIAIKISPCYSFIEKYISSISSRLQKTYLKNFNDIAQMEYQIYISRYNYIYLSYNHVLSQKRLDTLLLFNNINDYYNNLSDKTLTIGLNIDTPIKYIPNVRLEIFLDYHKISFTGVYLKTIFEE